MGTREDRGLDDGTRDVRGRARSQRSDAFNAAQRQAFLDRLAATCCVQKAIAASGACETTLYNTRRRDRRFAAAWDEALAIGAHVIESKLLDYVLREGAEPASQEARTGSGLAAGQVPGWVQIGFQLLNRHRASVSGERKMMPGAKTTPADTDAALAKRLAMIAAGKGPRA